MFGASHLLERWRIDDAVCAVPVHAVAGVWGTLAVAIFGDPAILGTGLSRGSQFLVQAAGAATAFVFSFGIVYVLARIISKKLPMRVSEEAERIGLNISEHGAVNELSEIIGTMIDQAKSGDLAVRVPAASSYSDVGVISECYNRVLDKLEHVMQYSNSIITNLSDGIIACDDKGRIRTVNPRAAAIFDQSEAELVGSQITDLLMNTSAEHHLELAEIIQHAGDVEPHEMPGVLSACAIRQGGERVLLELVVTDNTVAGAASFTLVIRDLTEMVTAAQERLTNQRRLEVERTSLAKAHDKLRKRVVELEEGGKVAVIAMTENEGLRQETEAVSRTKTRFLANMSYEIRTPLNAIIGFSDLLLDSELDSEQRQEMDTVQRSAEELLRVINDVLDISKVEAGRITAIKEPFNLEQLIHSANDFVRTNLHGKPVELICNLPH